ncbi:MAG: hypothetical protein ACRD5M_12325 [Candidatus Acidiferrales bacterium]
MPFIRGRYHMNAIAGQALEAAREADLARLASAGQQSQGDGEEEGDAVGNKAAPIHRVEIEAAETVPAHSGRAERGFVARVHREDAGNRLAPLRAGEIPRHSYAPRAETHVFSSHQDLLDFLQHEFAKDCAGK